MSSSLLGIFGAGLVTFVTPCVLPLVPVYLAALVGGDAMALDATGRLRLIYRALAFSTGFVGVFTLMGLGASSLGGLLVAHKAALQTAGGVLVLLFGLKLTGLIQIPLLDRVLRVGDRRLGQRASIAGAALMGVVFAAGWSPCVGPVLGTVLTYTATRTADPAVGALYLATYGAGFALPFLVTALLADVGVRWLRRARPWLGRAERAIGAALVLVALSLVFDFAPSVPPVMAAPAVAAGDLPRMVELYREDCAICREMKPVVAQVTGDCHGHGVSIETHDVNLGANRRLIEDYRLVGVPTFLFLDAEGIEVARLVGRQTPEALYQALATLRGEACPGVGALPRPPAELPCLDASGQPMEGETCHSTSTNAAPAASASTSSSG